MNLTKVVGRDNERRSRVHSRRGRVVVSGLFAAALRRNRRASGPWMAPGAVRRLDEIFRNGEMSLLELGSGVSTAWYAQRCRDVVSVEPDPVWAARTRAETAAFHNVNLVQGTVADFLEDVGDYDIVIVDHVDEPTMSRRDAVEIMKDRAAVIVLDDSDRMAYTEVDSILEGWTCERFAEFRSYPLQPTETTIWSRR